MQLFALGVTEALQLTDGTRQLHDSSGSRADQDDTCGPQIASECTLSVQLLPSGSEMGGKYQTALAGVWSPDT